MSERFTIDGSAALEAHLAATCQKVLAGVKSLVPAGLCQKPPLAGSKNFAIIASASSMAKSRCFGSNVAS